ncbi:MAG: hypothetical protein LBQ63_00890 [Deltaproteobacteria bacterium]|nr:hypothetical protein [Deltaproteobacteria bacterium]
MKTFILSGFRLLSVLAALCLFQLQAACSPQPVSLIPGGTPRIGVAPFTQPLVVSDLLAGYIPENIAKIDAAVFPRLDRDFAVILSRIEDRDFISREQAAVCSASIPKNAALPALDYWTLVGECMEADLLVVPQIIHWQERKGGDFGVEEPASVVMDIFLLDARLKALIARSRYDEKQRPLLENLLELDKFIERRGRWVGAGQLAQEGMFKAVKEFGL